MARSVSEQEVYDAYKEEVLRIVHEKTFVKSTLLPTLVNFEFYQKMESEDMFQAQQELVRDGQLRELEYTDDHCGVPNRVKTLYYDTSVSIQYRK